MTTENEMAPTTDANNVETHNTLIVAWEVPTAIECGQQFSIKFGVKCHHECRADGCILEVSDHDGKQLTKATLSTEPWPDTTALYYKSVELTAPASAGLFVWQVKVPATNLQIPHREAVASFNVRVVATPECVLTVEAIDLETQTPVEAARVVAHPYRAFTDKHGLAQLRVPKGEYRLFVSGKKYFPFRSDCEVNTDMTIRAELALDREFSDADIYT
jgi:hypothetical protein